MTAQRDLERRIAEFYTAKAPHRAPDRVLEQALATIDSTRQRRELSLVPRRSPAMNTFAKLAIAAVLVVAVGAIGLNLLPRAPGPSVGGDPSASAPPAESPSARPSPITSVTPALTPAPLTGTYTSRIHGLSIASPSGWTTVAATDPEATGGPEFLSPGLDVLHDPELDDHLFFVLGSRPLDGQTGEAWARAMVVDRKGDCAEPEPITVDGAPGLLCGELGVTWSGDRGYWVDLYTSDDEPELAEAYDRAWFEELLATVQLPDSN